MPWSAAVKRCRVAAVKLHAVAEQNLGGNGRINAPGRVSYEYLQKAKAKQKKALKSESRQALVHTCMAMVASQMYKICVAKKGFSVKQEK